MNGFWHKVIEKGRIAEWVITVGGVTLCILGGTLGFLDALNIVEIFLAMVVAVFGVEAMSK